MVGWEGTVMVTFPKIVEVDLDGEFVAMVTALTQIHGSYTISATDEHDNVGSAPPHGPRHERTNWSDGCYRSDGTSWTNRSNGCYRSDGTGGT